MQIQSLKPDGLSISYVMTQYPVRSGKTQLSLGFVFPKKREAKLKLPFQNTVFGIGFGAGGGSAGCGNLFPSVVYTFLDFFSFFFSFEVSLNFLGGRGVVGVGFTSSEIFESWQF